MTHLCTCSITTASPWQLDGASKCPGLIARRLRVKTIVILCRADKKERSFSDRRRPEAAGRSRQQLLWFRQHHYENEWQAVGHQVISRPGRKKQKPTQVISARSVIQSFMVKELWIGVKVKGTRRRRTERTSVFKYQVLITRSHHWSQFLSYDKKIESGESRIDGHCALALKCNKNFKWFISFHKIIRLKKVNHKRSLVHRKGYVPRHRMQ